MDVCIVGGGASGILILNQLVTKLINNNCTKVKNIFIIDKDNFRGGLAYSTEADEHILNMHASLMSAIPADKNDFIKWAIDSGKLSNDGYLPRRVYRDYLRNILNKTISQAKGLLNLKISLLVNTVMNIRSYLYNSYEIELGSHYFIKANICVLCLGHMPNLDVYNLRGSNRYINSPYADTSIDFASSTIGIIGSGLTAVDKIIELGNKYKSSKINCFSRSGLFPKIQTIFDCDSVRYFKDKMVAYLSNRKQVLADELIDNIEHNLSSHCGESINLLSKCNRDATGYTCLADDVNNARLNKKNSYMYLSSISDAVCLAWEKMNLSQKIVFKEKYFSSWMRYRHAMPLKNGYRLLNLFANNRLNIYPGLNNIEFNNNVFQVSLYGRNSLECDYIINCTGQRNMEGHDLVNKLLKTGLASANSLYGIDCNYCNNVIDKYGNIVQGLFAVGDITSGTKFYVSGIDHILDRAQVISTKIFGALNI